MKKSAMKEIVRNAIEAKMLCSISFKYNYYNLQCFPFQMSDRLILGARHDDFIIDGFSIRRFCDMTKVKTYNDRRNEILKTEGVLDGVSAPNIDLTDWRSAFRSLQMVGKNIIVEIESLDEDEWEFAIGSIEKVLKNKVIFKHFDADGIWQDELLEIPFSQITTVIFGSRYVETLSKYV